MLVKELDFSHFHPLDHAPWHGYCRTLPGGVRQHLRLAWQYRWRDRLRWPWRRLVLCPLGRHDIIVWWRHSDAWAICEFCRFERPPTEAETADRPPFFTP